MKFYIIDSRYCARLAKIDDRVPNNWSSSKQTRPFLGVVLTINSIHYYAPLSSPKPKHLTMKNNIDFLKINRGVLGVINFNNMIPAHLQDLALVNMKIFPADNDADRAYKNLLADQISWCNSNREVIYGKAQKLYAKVLAKRLNEAIVKRCCDFLKLEAEYRKYCKENELLP